MIGLAILLGLAIGLTDGQLNYEGNPLTEYTEYTAEESNLSESAVRDTSRPLLLAVPSRPQRLYPVTVDERLPRTAQAAVGSNHLLSDESRAQLPVPRHRSHDGGQASSRQNSAPISPAEVALNSFLNSRTPEESRASLDYYLRSQQQAPAEATDQSLRPATTLTIGQENKGSELLDSVAQRQPVVVQAEQSLLPRVDQQAQLTPQANQGGQLTSYLVQQQQQQLLPSADQGYGYVAAPQPVVQTAIVQPTIRGTPARILTPQGMPLVPLVPGLQARNDAITPAMWRQRMRRIRGKPFPFAQAKVAPGLYKGPVAGKRIT